MESSLLLQKPVQLLRRGAGIDDAKHLPLPIHAVAQFGYTQFTDISEGDTLEQRIVAKLSGADLPRSLLQEFLK